MLSTMSQRIAVARHADAIWELRLYIARHTPKSLAALANLNAICETHLARKYRIEVIDLLKRAPARSRRSDTRDPHTGAHTSRAGKQRSSATYRMNRTPNVIGTSVVDVGDVFARK